MSERSRSTDKQLDAAIWVVAGLIIASLLAVGGYVLYQRYGVSNIPPLVQKEIDKAKQSIEKDPRDADAHVTLARLYISEDMREEAKVELETALKINKNNVAALTLLGVIYEEKGEDNKAISYYKKAIPIAEKTEFKALNIYLYEAYFRLGQLYMKQKQYDKAIDVLKKDSELNSMDADLHHQLGLAYLKKGDIDSAIIELEDAIKYVPNFAEAHFALGQAYEKKGDKEKAIAEYDEAIKYKSDYKEAKEARDRLK